MSQEIKIPVSANTTGAERGLGAVDDAAQGVADSVGEIGKQARTAAADVKKLTDQTAELARQRERLEKTLGGKLSESDVLIIGSNFDQLRRLRGHYGRQARMANSPADLLDMVDRLYAESPKKRERARGDWMAQLTQGTSLARPPPPPPEGGGEFERGMRRIGVQAMGFGKSMLALAGITSAVAMAGKAIELATEESVGLDTIKRRFGDLGVDFDRLQGQARAAGDGLGVTYVESQRLARAFVDEAGNLKAADVGSLGSRLHTQFGFARSFGLDPAASVQFFGQMARYGVGRDDASQRRLALLIGDAVARSAYGGQVDDILRAIANYTATNARATLTNANSETYANALTSLSSRGLPGLDPASAAVVLGTADQAIRHGGGMGDASKTFLYAMLRNRYPGINPVEATAVTEGGLFATTRSTFGPITGADGRVHENPLRQFMGQHVPLDDTTVFEMAVSGLKRAYGNSPWGKSMVVDAAANTFGVTHAQAAALLGMADKGQLGASITALRDAGVDPMRLNATGFSMIAQLANAHGRGALNEAFGSIVNRSDLTDAQRTTLQGVMTATSGMDDQQATKAMISAVSKMNIAQEMTEGEKTRQSISGVTDALTKAGAPLLVDINMIRDAVVAIANHMIPGGYMDLTGTNPVRQTSLTPGQIQHVLSRYDPKLVDESMKDFMAMGNSPLKAAAMTANMLVESSGDPNASNHVAGGHRGLFQWNAERWAKFQKWAAAHGIKDLLDRHAQRLFFNDELYRSFQSAGSQLNQARSPEDANFAVINDLRPKGWQEGHWRNPGVEGFHVREALTEQLYAKYSQLPPPAPTTKAATIEHHIHVHVHQPNGKTDTHTVKIPTASSAPAPAGAQRPSGGGRAPLVGGHIDYPADGNYAS